MAKRIPFVDGDEHDAFCRICRKRKKWKAGRRKKIKQKYNRRERRLKKRELQKWQNR